MGSRSLLACVLGAVVVGACAAEQEARTNEPIVGGGEAVELMYVGMPKNVPATARIAPENEPGERMRLTGTVKDQNGSPVAGVIIYAYQTDKGGIYPRADTRHGRLRGWAKSDAGGRYTFETIRPGSYPDSTNPQHVHMHVIEPGRCGYWIDDAVFSDDPFLNESERDRRSPRGGRGVTTPTKRDGVWIAERNVTLGLNVPGYPAR